MKISLAITCFNRTNLLLRSFEQILDDPRITEIVIVDDCSDLSHYHWVKKELDNINNPKIKLHRNPENLGMSRNKARAISLCKNPWVIILDSDNTITSRDYLDPLEKQFYAFEHMDHVILSPSFARPNFDYRKFTGWVINKLSAPKLVGDKDFDCLLNTCNYIVNRDFYLETYQYDPTVMESDTINHNYNHFKAGGSIIVLEEMEYDHLVHEGSGWLSHAAANLRKAKEIQEKIKQL